MPNHYAQDPWKCAHCGGDAFHLHADLSVEYQHDWLIDCVKCGTDPS